MFTTIFVQPLFNVLFALYGLLPGHDFGVAVIGVTILVRLILWPLVTRQLHSQKAMQALAPEVAKVREKAGGDRQKETQLLMELYKDKGTSPFAPILPLLIQLPIFFALYIVFRDAVHPDKIAGLTYGFVSHIPAVANVIAHNSSFSPTLLGLVNLTKPSLVLAITAGLAQWYQAKMLQPKNQPLDTQARLMANMIYIFPILTILVGLTLPSALALYWTVTSLVAALQQYLVLMRDAHEMEDRADAAELKAAPAAIAVGAGGGVVASPKSARKKKRSGKGGKR
jgi:YidC/Oxa1 family membrane protein insertase